MRILKFGGKSLDTEEKMQKIAIFIKECYKNDNNLIIIVSAIGSYTDQMFTKFPDIKSKREFATALSTGETISSAIMANLLCSIDVPAKSFQGFQLPILCKGEYDNAIICSIGKEKILNCFKNEEVAVVSGFQGINDNNEIVTLGRGGSDTTAAALGAIFDTNVELYSDFDGIFAGDPRIENFKKYEIIPNKTVQKLATTGSKIISKKALMIAKKFDINLITKSSSLPHSHGSLVLSNSHEDSIDNNLIFLSISEDLCNISIIFNNFCDFYKINNAITELYKIANIIKINYFDNCFTITTFMKEETKIIKELSSKLDLLNK